ncbi:MAG TPA: hypothetical protein VK031_08090, partial [Tissierellaceae bacterium]|nr:hypothetical protein [Tissierellaceae bacterium]
MIDVNDTAEIYDEETSPTIRNGQIKVRMKVETVVEISYNIDLIHRIGAKETIVESVDEFLKKMKSNSYEVRQSVAERI